MMLQQIYSELILEHNKKTPHRGHLENATHVERGHNPSCGDDITLLVQLEDGRIKAAKFVGTGCAISVASTSIMIDLVNGKTIEEARDLVTLYLQLIQGESLPKEAQKRLKDAMAFSGIKDMPARVKCATLGWHCLKVIIA